MTTIIIQKRKDNSYSGFYCMGHADFAKKHLFYKEPDILCASISVLVINTINSLEELCHETLEVSQNEETGFIKCDFKSSLNEKSIVLLESMIFGLQNISKDYGENYLLVKFEEV